MNRRQIAIGVLLTAAAAAGIFFFASEAPPVRAGAVSAVAPKTSDKASKLAARDDQIKVRPDSASAQSPLAPDPINMAELNSINLADQFDSLMARARKDPAFAQSLAFALHQCSLQLKGYKLLLARLEKMSAEEATASMARADREFAKCRGLSPDQLATRIDLAELAARAGILQAQLYYRRFINDEILDGTVIRTPGLMDRYRTNAEAFTVAAAQSGNPEGIYAAYDFYQNGHLGPPNLVRAYQYAQQLARASPGPNAQRLVDDLAARMTADELRRARGG